MLFAATHTHPASKCPLEMPEGKAIIKKLLSDENVKKSGLKIVAAYVSCPKDKSAEHKGFFIVTRALYSFRLETSSLFLR